jgi:hypothetical protein
VPSEWVLWNEIRDEVTAYFDQSSPWPWSIDDDVLGSQGLAINFFFPLRTDRRGLSRLLGLLCGCPRVVVQAFNLVCRGRAANAPQLFDIVTCFCDSRSSQSILLIKCMPPIGYRRSHDTSWDESAPALQPAFRPFEPACDRLLPDLARAQRLAEDLERRNPANRVMFAVVYDNRDLSYAEICDFWCRTQPANGRFYAWTYQQLLGLAASTTAVVPGWRTFLAQRYGITGIGACSSAAEPCDVFSDERKPA